MLGLSRGTVVLTPYRIEWARLFDDEAGLLRSVLGEEHLPVEHIGSTSIRGMDAKPILDIMIGMVSMDRANAAAKILSNIGYQRRTNGDLPDRVFLVKGPEHLRTHHLSLTYFNSPFWAEHLLFRDALRENAALAAEYADLKRSLAREYSHNRSAYTAGKEQFVRDAISRARHDKDKQSEIGHS